MSEHHPDLPGIDGARVLIVDDEPAILRTFRYCLEDSGYRVTTTSNSEQALDALNREVFDVCFLDLRLGDESGLELLPQIKALAPWVRVVIATAHSSVDSAVDTMRAGAADYLVKPCSPDQLRFAAAKQVEARQMELRLQTLEREADCGPKGNLETDSPVMARVLDEARRVADTNASVLILGESGTGKGVLARAIHEWSPRRDKNFATINCPSLSSELLESEMFGHRKGAFTGATESTQGRVAIADGGTLFMDEVGDFPLGLQPKLLRFVQDREYERVGDPVSRVADVRIVAATNRDLEEMVAKGEFREDLLYRLNVITLTLPPLRERPEDVLNIATGCLKEFARSYGRPAREFTEAAIGRLLAYRWPGNVRELRNVIERAAILSPDERVGVNHLSITGSDTVANTAGGVIRVGAPVSLDALERMHIAAVVANSATLEAAARTLGIDSSTLYRKRKQYDLS
ncbi:sigma-54-dependent transcriptional regulator [Alkalisalibacterium limincola]|uniref:Sigma-54-dependent Fis family transcriptional regulator n=1 Tax=Alkalisalibacterium limincola TaxID=2699169 RepID=A0A5C8KN55_9GAMM|nr:sigma-54 dependent transcriptional regulator [Alkalisalibacterium limincola]TXK60774.1 sigma-54-dependent Fis family transcriptional regulator [Alkalisalibacterium limincola]